jgi:hypothetical protein
MTDRRRKAHAGHFECWALSEHPGELRPAKDTPEYRRWLAEYMAEVKQWADGE